MTQWNQSSILKRKDRVFGVLSSPGKFDGQRRFAFCGTLEVEPVEHRAHICQEKADVGHGMISDSVDRNPSVR